MQQRLNSAFTLLELAIVLVIVGLMAGFGLKAYTVEDSSCYDKTRQQLIRIQGAIETFVRTNNRYPKPAYIGLGSNDTAFGREQTGGVATSAAAYATTVPAGMANSANALIGGLPFATLGLNASDAADCWGSKFIYSVTNALTSSDAAAGYPGAAAGVINVKTGTTAANSNLSTTAAYAVISTGENKLGSTPLSANDVNGNIGRSCSAGTPTDSRNCDIAPGTADNIFFSTTFNNGATGTASYFDDLIVYGDKAKIIPADCEIGTSITWLTNCTHTLSSKVLHTATTTVTNTLSNGYTGSAGVTCTNGTLALNGSPAGTCTSGGGGCSGGTANWGAGCTASYGALADGGTQAVSDPVGASPDPYTGGATVRCTTGVISIDAGSTCYANCLASTAPTTLTWNTNCSAPRPFVGHGSAPSIANTAASYTGSVTGTCNNGTLTLSGGTCTPSSVNCSSQTVNWNGTASGCSMTGVSGTDGQTNIVITNSATGKTGSGTASCSGGTITANAGATCYNQCTSTTVTWNTNCSAVASGMNHGDSGSYSNSAPGYSGSATIGCNNGTYTTSGTSCSVVSGSTNMFCWGMDVQNLGTDSGQPVPKAVPSTQTFTSITVGQYTRCGLTGAGQAYCWGENFYGELGDGTTTPRTSAVAVSQSGMVFTSIQTSATGRTTCALRNNSKIYCWGSNASGVFGNGTHTGTSTTPVAVAASLSFSKIYLGGHLGTICGITTGGQSYCWGSNSLGETGTGTSGLSVDTPTLVSGGYSFADIVVGENNSCGITAAGVAYCWGLNTNGQTGDGTMAGTTIGASKARLSPVAVAGGLAFSKISPSQASVCGLTTAGTAYCWGQDLNGTLGRGSYGVPPGYPTPAAVVGGHVFTDISVDGAHVCAIKNDGRVYCWGGMPYANAYFSGSVTNISSHTPTQMYCTGQTYSKLVTANGTTCGLSSNATDTCSGAPINGECPTESWGDYIYCRRGTYQFQNHYCASGQDRWEWICNGYNGGASSGTCTISPFTGCS